jgi:hypothetical protein
MNITTNLATFRPGTPGFFGLYIDGLEADQQIVARVNTHGRIVLLEDENGDRLIAITGALDPVHAVIREILADIKKAASWIAYCESTLGGQIADPYVALRQPVGHWVYADAKARRIELRENRSMIDAAACGVTA